MGAAELQTLVSTAASSGAASWLSPKNSTATANVVRHEAVRCASNTATSVETIADSIGWASPCGAAEITLRMTIPSICYAWEQLLTDCARDSRTILRCVFIDRSASEHTGRS